MENDNIHQRQFQLFSKEEVDRWLALTRLSRTRERIHSDHVLFWHLSSDFTCVFLDISDDMFSR